MFLLVIYEIKWKIIENDEFDEILNPNFNKNLYREKVNRVIFDNKFKLFKIQETNFRKM